MKRDPNVHDESGKKDLRQLFRAIREDVEQANTGEDLTELYKRAAHLIMMTHASPINANSEEKTRRRLAEREFAATVQTINRRAKKIDAPADHSEKWDELTINGYEAEGDNLLEPESIEK